MDKAARLWVAFPLKLLEQRRRHAVQTDELGIADSRTGGADRTALRPVIPQRIVALVLVADNLVAQLWIDLLGVDRIEEGGDFA